MLLPNSWEAQTWLQRFKESLDCRRRRMKLLQTRRALRYEDELQAVERDLEVQSSLLKHEDTERFPALKDELTVLQQVLTVEAASQVWQPVAVSNHHRRVLEQAASDVPARTERVKQQLMECRLNIRALKNRITSLESRQDSVGENLTNAREAKPWLDGDSIPRTQSDGQLVS